MTLDSQGSVYNILVSSASTGLKYNLAKSIANQQRNVPHLFTLTFKLGSKAPVHISPVHVRFGAGTIKISSFVCLVGIGLGIGTYAVYKIYKQVFPIGGGSLPTLLKQNGRDATKADKIKVNASNSSTDNGHDNHDEHSEICRKHSQTSERHCRRRKVARPKHATPSTDSDAELNGLKSGSADKPPRISRHSSDLGFISMKSSQLLPQGQTSDDKISTDVGARSNYNLVDDHRGKRFVITPIEAEEGVGPQPPLDHPLRCTSVTGHRRMQSTPDELDGNLLDLSEIVSEDKTRGSSEHSTDSKDSGSDSDRTGLSLSQPSSEMFETAKDIVLSGTLTEMEQLQSQLDLLSNDVDDLNCEMESLQKREDPLETVQRRYTLGAEEALTAKKEKSRDANSKKVNKNRSRFLRKLDFQNSLSKENRTRSCDLLGSDRSEDGVAALVESVECTADPGSEFMNSLISNVCSELDQLSNESSSYGIVQLSDVSDSSISDEQILENLSELLPRNIASQTFVIKQQSVLSNSVKNATKRKKIDFDLTDDLYIDDDLISPSSDRKKNLKASHRTCDIMSPILVRPQSMGSSNDSHYRTPNRSFAANLASPFFENDVSYFHRLASRDSQMNLVNNNNNLNINLISELLYLTSGDGPLSPRTSDFLATCMESPDRASSNLDSKVMRTFMEKIGEAVVNFGRSTLPLRRCSGKACSTPNVLASDKDHLQIFQSTVEKLCDSFPFWVVKNLEEPTDVLEYVEKKFCANTESHLFRGYDQVGKLTDARHVCSVRKDNFCLIRATLCQSIISDKLKSFSERFVKDHEKFFRIFEETGNEYLKSSSFSNRIPYNKGSEMDVLRSCFDLFLSVVISQEAIHSKVHDPAQKEKQLRSLLDGLFNGCPIVDLHLMEAIKMLMMVEAIELYKCFQSSTSQSESLAWAIFSGKLTQNPEQLFKNRICAIGDTQILNEVETSLLARSLKIKLEILRPAHFLGQSDGFVSHYPDEGADDCDKVTLVQEADNSFVLLLQ